jgi:hypothetical protein
MTFGLKNAGATYQKAIQKCLKTQIGKNVEAYVDDVVVKTTEEDKLIADLTETFANLMEAQPIKVCLRCPFRIAPGLHGRAPGHGGQPSKDRRHTQDGQAIQQERRHEAH